MKLTATQIDRLTHDLRSPLATAKLYLELLPRQSDPAQILHSTQVINNKVDIVLKNISLLHQVLTLLSASPVLQSIDLSSFIDKFSQSHSQFHFVLPTPSVSIQSDLILLTSLFEAIVDIPPVSVSCQTAGRRLIVNFSADMPFSANTINMVLVDSLASLLKAKIAINAKNLILKLPLT